MLALALTVAHATPVVHDGDPGAAIQTAQRHLGPADRQPIPLEQLLAADPALRVGAAVGCTQPSDPVPGVAGQIEALEGALLYLELDRAADLVDAARRAAVCATAPVDAAELARIELLDGIRHELLDDPQGAAARFAVAVGYDPAVPWNDAFPPERRPRFDEARAAEPQPGVALTIHPAGAVVTVDGGSATPPLSLSPGEHLITVGGVGVRIEVEADVPDTLVVPAAFGADALSWMADDRRSDLSALLAQGLGEGVAAVVVSGDSAWSGTTGRTDWRAHPATPTTAGQTAPDPVPLTIQPPRWPKTLMVIGGGLAVAGGVAAGLGWQQGGAAAQDAAVPLPPEDYAALQQRYDRAAVLTYIGYGVAGVGLSTTSLGLVFTIR